MRRAPAVIYVTNAFSLQMLPDRSDQAIITAVRLGVDEARMLLEDYTWASAIGHADLAALVSADLGVEIKADRRSVTLDNCDQLLVVQYRGPRLPEGATTLPEGAVIEYWRVSAMLGRF